MLFDLIGLGELTFLQLSTTYAPPSVAGHGIGYFAAGRVLLGWSVRGLGVRTGVGISSILPFIIPLVYFFLLPKNTLFLYSPLSPSATLDRDYDGDSVATLPYTPLATGEDEVGEEEGSIPAGLKAGVALSMNDKLRLVRPLLVKYMLPLFCVYLFEYTINQGIAPTLLYPVPSPESSPILSKVIHSIRDYYPLWQLLPLPSIVQGFILVLLAAESSIGFFDDDMEGASILLVFFLISLEGICGGLAYVNAFYHLNQERPDPNSAHNMERTKQEKEFKIGSVGFADSSGILFASLLAVPTEISLCKAQVNRGKTLCKGL
ncbi:hypothetical protein D9758_005426 [Tetrapyrgos nigripes]|uniref:Protein BTN n=1 Tax=Tetrapyrgos nigripes TaxID=182062 RepID=A0A8H5LQ34_9AGAR|nr:hypothetical protein D9758_005426 [Tetrapyrgos nigripes]